jgi:hypothetical protein
MSHLSTDELVDRLDGTLAPARLAHLDHCDHCRGEAAWMDAQLSGAREAAAPALSCAGGRALSQRISEALASEPSPGRGWLAWLRGPVLVPVAGLAALVSVLAASIDRAVPVRGHAPSAAMVSQAMDETDPQDAWSRLADALRGLDVLEAGAALGVGPGMGTGVRGLVSDLSAAERVELHRLIEGEWGGPQS